MSSPRQVFVLCGFAGSGKSTVANYLKEVHNSTILNYADTLKDIVSILFGWDRDLIAGLTAESRTWREKIDTWWSNRLGFDVTPRSALQQIGTDVFRKHFSNEIWIAALERKIETVKGNLVIGDARFQNEIEVMQKLGAKVIHIKRGPDPEWLLTAQNMLRNDPAATLLWLDLAKKTVLPHFSEIAWINADVDYTIQNDGTVKELHAAVDALIE